MRNKSKSVKTRLYNVFVQSSIREGSYLGKNKMYSYTASQKSDALFNTTFHPLRIEEI